MTLTAMASSTPAISRTWTARRRSGTLLIGKRFVCDPPLFPPCTHTPYPHHPLENPRLTPPQELIKVRGFQVAPPELEAILISHPSIVDAGVIGVPAPAASRDGEVPRAYVVQRPGTAPLTEQEVVEYAAKRLAGYKRLAGGVRFVAAIPKNPSGKILKRELRELARKEGVMGVGAKL